jgi:GTPase involved in cell partitioning and DNA repair
MLLFPIDIIGVDERNPANDLEALSKELAHYDRAFLEKYLIIADKIDLHLAEDDLKAFQKSIGEKILAISSVRDVGIEMFKGNLRMLSTDN